MVSRFRTLLDHLLPPPRWRIAAALIAGAFFGLGLLVLHIANATSYLSDRPEACMNCHVMAPQFATWQRGSHGRVTVCNDCHVPHDNVFRKFAFKASDGLRHSFMFTFRLEPQVIQVKRAGISVLQENCQRCHTNLLERSTLASMSAESARHGEGKLCWDCHRDTPHGRVNSLASVPYARVPRLTPPIPAWMTGVVTANRVPTPPRSNE
ncbi:MAG: cytochrome c nitrite reductase small subunit [Bacteroidota bacterium]